MGGQVGGIRVTRDERHPESGPRPHRRLDPIPPGSAITARPMAEAPTRARHVVVAWTLAIAAVAYLDRVCISTAAPAMKADLGLTDAQMGYVFSAFTFAYALFEVPSGWLADRFGARLMLTRIVIWWSAMTAATGLAGGFASLLAVRFLFGVGEAGTFPSIARAYGRWLPARERGRAFGLALDDGGARRRGDAAAGGGLLACCTGGTRFRSSASSAWCGRWPGTGGSATTRTGTRGVNAAELELIGCDPPVPQRAVPWAALLRSRSLLALCFMYAVRDLRLVFLHHLAADLSAAGARLRPQQVGWLAALPLLSIAAGVFAGGWASDVLVRRWGARARPRDAGARRPAAGGAGGGWRGHRPPTRCSAGALAGRRRRPGGVRRQPGVGRVPGDRRAPRRRGQRRDEHVRQPRRRAEPGGVGLSLQRWGSWNVPLLTSAGCYIVAAACWLASTRPSGSSSSSRPGRPFDEPQPYERPLDDSTVRRRFSRSRRPPPCARRHGRDPCTEDADGCRGPCRRLDHRQVADPVPSGSPARSACRSGRRFETSARRGVL